MVDPAWAKRFDQRDGSRQRVLAWRSNFAHHEHALTAKLFHLDGDLRIAQIPIRQLCLHRCGNLSDRRSARLDAPEKGIVELSVVLHSELPRELRLVEDGDGEYIVGTDDIVGRFGRVGVPFGWRGNLIGQRYQGDEKCRYHALQPVTDGAQDAVSFVVAAAGFSRVSFCTIVGDRYAQMFADANAEPAAQCLDRFNTAVQLGTAHVLKAEPLAAAEANQVEWPANALRNRQEPTRCQIVRVCRIERVHHISICLDVEAGDSQQRV